MATSTERFGFTKPAGSDPASIVPLNSNTDLIEQYLGRTQDMIAPMYDDTATYDAGDIVTYESNLYKCITAISTAETFDPTKWERTTASESGGGGSAELDILGEASGAVASFADGASAGLAKCIAEIVPKQAGSGDPSPTNVRPISGWTNETITVIDDLQNPTVTHTTTIPFTDSQGQSVEVFGGTLDVTSGVLTVDRAMVDIGSLDWKWESFRKGFFWTELKERKLNTDIISSTYKYFSSRPSDLYSEIGIYQESLLKNYIDVYNPNYNNVSDFVEAMSGQSLVYELATPQTVQLTPQEVNSLLGQNNISADTGDIDIVYVKASAPIQPNPTGTPTATLKKLGIEGTVFEVEGAKIEYSTNEHVVGTWIDGRPLYEKTYYIPTQTGPHMAIDNSISMSNADVCFVTNFSYKFGNYINSVPMGYEIGLNSNEGVFLDFNHSISPFGSGLSEIYITIRYTKVVS